MSQQSISNHAALETICRQYGLQILYAFGSRGKEAYDWVAEAETTLPTGASDLDIGIKTAETLTVRQKVELAIALEDLFGVNRVDLVVLPEVDPFLAANVIRGERLFADDHYMADEYDLYILRRAGDLAFLERQRQALILGTRA